MGYYEQSVVPGPRVEREMENILNGLDIRQQLKPQFRNQKPLNNKLNFFHVRLVKYVVLQKSPCKRNDSGNMGHAQVYKTCNIF